MAFERIRAALDRTWRGFVSAVRRPATGGTTPAAPSPAPAAAALAVPLAEPSSQVPPAAKIQDLTGAGITTPFHVGGTDLGIPVLTPAGRLLLVFGDTFEGPKAGDGDWRSPVGLYADPASVTSGLRWIGAARGVAGREGYAGQLLDYHHPGPGVPEDVVHGLPISTQLPSDVIRLGDALYLQVMGVRGLPNVQFTELYKSLDDGETWASTGCWWPGDRWNGWFQNVTLCEGDDGFVYCVSTSFSRTRGLMLSRVAVGAIERADAWEPWGWTSAEGWGWGRPPAFVLPGRFGETCLRRVDGHWLLCAFDEGNARIDVRLLSGPTADMTVAPVGTLARNAPRDAEDHAHGAVSQLYGGYVLPGSTLGDLHVVISQWFTPGPEEPYRAMQFRGDVSALARGVPDDRRV